MIRDDILEWLIIAVLAAGAILVLMLVEGTVFEAGARAAKAADVRCTMDDVRCGKRARCARGSEEMTEREYLMWHEECADLREAAMERYEEKMKGGRR